MDEMAHRKNMSKTSQKHEPFRQDEMARFLGTGRNGSSQRHEPYETSKCPTVPPAIALAPHSHSRPPQQVDSHGNVVLLFMNLSIHFHS